MQSYVQADQHKVVASVRNEPTEALKGLTEPKSTVAEWSLGSRASLIEQYQEACSSSCGW
jgi:hypothetical protein